MLNIVKRTVRRLVGYNNVCDKVDQSISKLTAITQQSISQIEQKRIFLHFQQLLAEKKQLPSICDVGFRVYSQSDEDGILLYLFAAIGAKNKKCLDIAFASPYGANTTNLLVNWGWTGLLVCGGANEAISAKSFFSSHPDTQIFPPTVESHWITAENVNDVVAQGGLYGEIDLFCLDIDGVDYWIWKKLEVVQPRVVVVEAHNVWGAEKAVTVPYEPRFNRFNVHKDYFGASVPAFVKLAQEKGYRLVGCNKYGFNLFFLKNEIAQESIPTMSIERCFDHPQSRARKNECLEAIKKFPWIEV